jgi:hypothetical protein
MNTIEAGGPASATWHEETHGWTWHEIVAEVLAPVDRMTLKELYRAIEPHPKTHGKKHWQARLRETLERSPEFVRVGPGVWSFASNYSPEQVAEFNRIRREEHPLLGRRQKKVEE